MVSRAISELVKEGKIARSDGGSEAADKAAAAAGERQRLEQIAAPPITMAEHELFASLSPQELERKYWGTNVVAAEFRARYGKAVREHGFRLPPKPAASADVPAEGDSGEWSRLTAAQYLKMPIAQICRLYKSNTGGFRVAVDRLIAEGRI